MLAKAIARLFVCVLAHPPVTSNEAFRIDAECYAPYQVPTRSPKSLDGKTFVSTSLMELCISSAGEQKYQLVPGTNDSSRRGHLAPCGRWKAHVGCGSSIYLLREEYTAGRELRIAGMPHKGNPFPFGRCD